MQTMTPAQKAAATRKANAAKAERTRRRHEAQARMRAVDFIDRYADDLALVIGTIFTDTNGGRASQASRRRVGAEWIAAHSVDLSLAIGELVNPTS